MNDAYSLYSILTSLEDESEPPQAAVQEEPILFELRFDQHLRPPHSKKNRSYAWNTYLTNHKFIYILLERQLAEVIKALRILHFSILAHVSPIDMPCRHAQVIYLNVTFKK